MKKSLIIATLLTIFSSCQKDYEKKILKVDITCDATCAWAWEDKQFGACESASSRTIYYKEGSQLKVRVNSCSPSQKAHITVKVKGNTLYDNTATNQTIDVTVSK